MMKKQILLLFLSLMSAKITLSQQVVTTKGDKVNINDFKVEPWRVQGTTNQADDNIQNIYQNGNVGVGDLSALVSNTKFNIKPTAVTQEALRVQDMLDVNAISDSFDGSKGSFSNLEISDEGYVRKVKPTAVELNNAQLYNLSPNYSSTPLSTAPNAQANFSSSMVKMGWQYTDVNGATVNTTDFILPNSGAYIFSFNLFGNITTPDDGPIRAYYIYAFKNNRTFDLAEINLIQYNQRSYTVSLSVSGAKGDVVSFAMTNWSGIPSYKLISTPGLQANKTSMRFWKIENYR